MGGPVAPQAGEKLVRWPGTQRPTQTSWMRTPFLLARHRAGRERLFNPEDKLLYRFEEHRELSLS